MLFQSIYNRNATNLEWLKELRVLRNVKEVSLRIADAESCAEFILDRLVEAYVEEPTGFPRKLELWSTDDRTESKWIGSIRSRNDAQKQTKSVYSTFHFADPSMTDGNVKMTVAIAPCTRSVYLYRGCVDIRTAFPHAADFNVDTKDNGLEQGDYDYEESSDGEAESWDNEDQ
ncbi:hypothetical protein AAVH_42537 [Aphelenchoides avenae]|nr:hypothetical protein AAVH_42537 [Aphelenchus avenae]